MIKLFLNLVYDKILAHASRPTRSNPSYAPVPKCPSGACILVLGVDSSFGSLHITQVVRGWQPFLRTLAHFVLLFPLPFFLWKF
jgi:hypothetical protein